MRELGRTPDDRLGVELEFLHLLTLLAAQAEAGGDEAACRDALARRETFLRKHAARWMPAFADAFAGSTQEPAFRAAAALLRVVAELR